MPMPNEVEGAATANDGLSGYINMSIEITEVVVAESQIPSMNLENSKLYTTTDISTCITVNFGIGWLLK